MTGEPPGAVFSIGSQVGNVHNIAGDMTIHGGQQYTSGSAGLMQRELEYVRQIIGTLGLSPEIQGNAGVLLAEAEQQLSRPDYDAHKTAGLIARLAGYLKEFGALSAGGVALAECFHRLAQILGPAGASIMHLL